LGEIGCREGIQMRAAALLLCLGASLLLEGQTGTGGTTPTAGTSGGENRGADVSRPIYISGKVVMEDGAAVMPNITIERVCSGISKTVAYADAKGRFTFRWDDRSMVMDDASDAGSGPTSRANTAGFGGSQSAGGANILAADPFGSRMMNCALRANVAGYTSDTINLFNRRSSDVPDVGSIVLRRITGIEGSSISVTSMMAPKDAKKAYERGLQSQLKNKPEDAARDFERAVALYPKYADAWVSLAKLRLQRQAEDSARAALRKAMEADPKLVTPYLELGLLAARDADWQKSASYLDRAVALDPVDFPQAWYADAVAHYNLKNYEAAEKSARTAVKLDARHANPRADYLLGLVLLEKKDYTGAAAEFTTYLKLAPNAPELAQVKDQLTQVEKLQAK
jgi:tetratricopeptide (TPR) repeat protein